jgi:tetratricopeptide (TPR) repeat protein
LLRARLTFAHKGPRAGESPVRGRAEYDFIEIARPLARAAPKEKKMKRNLALWLGLLTFALLPALAQAPSKPMGKIHGHITAMTGVAANAGIVSLSTDDGHTAKFTFQVTATGDYAGEANPGNYMAIYREPDVPVGQITDSFNDAKIVLGRDLQLDFDMTRKEFISKLSPAEKKQLEELKQKNAEAMKSNEVIKSLNTDIKQVVQDINDAESAQAAAAQELGASATKSDLIAKIAEIKKAKYTEVETVMLKDTQLRSDASALWKYLGVAQLHLQKYDDAAATFQKVLDLEAAVKPPKKPNPAIQGDADASLGEIYARAGKVPEAIAAFDAAATFNPELAANYLTNESVIFSQIGNAEAQIAAADKAIKVDPAQALPYYLKGQGLIQKAEIDSKTGKMILPPGCEEAYEKYLELAPTGRFAADVKGILSEATQTHSSSFGSKSKKK